MKIRPGEELSPEELCESAAEVLRRSGRSQSEIAEELDRSKSAISRALNEPGARFSKLQCEIISLLTPFEVREQRIYLIRGAGTKSKENGASDIRTS
jgi:hypothetical protein